MGFWRKFLVTGLALMSLSARAADLSAPTFGPAADWVSPVKLDLTPSKLAKDAPTAMLLRDYQVRFKPDGTDFYYELVTKAQTPQGLQSVGSVSLSWDPATQRLIIHKLKVSRSGKEIDYLTDGPGFLTLRRETRLEAATLDGALTATTQLEGIEVGDIVDVAYTIEQADPLMKGHVEADFGLTMGPVRKLRMRFTWPSSMAVAWRALSHAPDLTLRNKDGWTEAVLDREDPVDSLPPNGAPARYLRGPEMQLGNFAGWSDVSALLSGEFAEAEVMKPDSALSKEAQAIAAQTSDPKARAEAALALVQNKIRYVLLALDGGGLKPAAADLTWSRRFADCKGKTVVLLALLHALGIEAEPVLASQEGGDGLDQRLPLLAAFDHVLVRATIGGRVYWLDGTRTGDRALDMIRIPSFQWGLPIRASGGDLIRLEAQDYADPTLDSALRLDASAGLSQPISAHGEMVLRGDAAVGFNLALSSLSAANLDTVLKEDWRRRYDYIEVKSATAHFDAETQEERLTMDGVATLDWRTDGGPEIPEVEYQRYDFQRQPGPDETVPVKVAYPRWDRRSVTIVLPNQGHYFSFLGEDVNEVDAGVHFERHLSLKNGTFSVETEAHALAVEVSRAEAEAAVKRMADLSKRAVRLVPSRYYQFTPQERTAMIASTPVSALDYLNRGDAYLDQRDYDHALADFDQAVGLDPTSSVAWGDRALTWAWKGDAAKSLADAAEALRLNPKETVALRAQGFTANRQGRYQDAIVAFGAALAVEPRDTFSRIRRAWAYLRAYQPQDALKECDAGLVFEPDNDSLLGDKADALLDLDRGEEAAAIARSMMTRPDEDVDRLIRAARLLKRSGHDEEAMASIDKAVSLKPTVGTLLARANLRSFADLAGALADAGRALALDGQSKDALIALTKLNYQARNYPEALKWGTQAAQRNANDVGTLTLVGGLHHALGQETEAAARFDQAHKAAGEDGSALNNLCWGEATMNYDLPGALADCDAALKLRPGSPQFLDSHAFVLLRLGRDEEALAEYDAALRDRPSSAASLLGRSIAERRTGRTEAADRDQAAAVRKEKAVVEWFRLYGLEG